MNCASFTTLERGEEEVCAGSISRPAHEFVSSTGHYPCILSRRDLLHILHDALPKHAQSRVLADKKVSQIRRTDSGVTVSCTDGTTYHGTFVIGADGAFSTVRSAMRELALDAGSREVNEAEPFTTRYQALWVRFPTATMPFGKPGSAAETHGPGIATQLFSGEESSTVGLYRQLATPTRTSSRYDDKDEAALVREWEHLPLLVQKCADATGGGVLRLRDVYQARLGSGLVSLEEGVLPLWSWDGHVVLVGDAAHKFTPSTGSGLNYGMMDVVALINELHALLSHHDHGRGDSSQPWCSPAALAKAFRAYQQKRMAEVTAGCQQAGGATAMATWSNVGLRLLDQYILPMSFVQSFIGSRITSRARSAKPLAFEC